MTRFFALDEIRPGDAILMSGPTWKSRAIRLATVSSYSHVAIAIHPFIWFEALDNEVKFRVIHPTLVMAQGKLRFGLPFGSGHHYDIYRPNALVELTCDVEARASTAKRLIEVVVPFAFLDYAEPESFLPILRMGLGDFPIVRRIARSLRRRNSKAFSGPFCSWLVAACYEALHLKLFSKAPDQLLPGAFARSENFDGIPATFVGDEFCARAELVGPFHEMLNRISWNEVALKALGSGARTSKGLHDFEHNLRRFLKVAWLHLDRPIPKHDTSTMRRAQARHLRDFSAMQGRASSVLKTSYHSVSGYSESIGSMSDCSVECKTQIDGRSWCGRQEFRLRTH